MIDEKEQAALDKIERQLRETPGLSEDDVRACLAVVRACFYETRNAVNVPVVLAKD